MYNNLAWLWSSSFTSKVTFSSFKGGPESSKLVLGNVNSFDLENLEGGVSYTVKVTALIGNREGNPVSITVTTRKTYSSIFMCQITTSLLFEVVGGILAILCFGFFAKIWREIMWHFLMVFDTLHYIVAALVILREIR